ncbi:hypothetical protein [Salinimicrobium gaetbulicola]|uniref:Uncharacterized protein n=1 Tax=Salinimicrobium gaetbulicola TaxID=999702 RepID=A0ABW3IEM8_9FLAO
MLNLFQHLLLANGDLETHEASRLGDGKRTSQVLKTCEVYKKIKAVKIKFYGLFYSLL